MSDAIVISDLHLGSDVCQAKAIESFLDFVPTVTAHLVLNGDVFDSLDFQRLKKHHWNVLSKLRKMSDKIKVSWVCGNHDGQAEMLGHLLGVEVVDECVLESGSRSMLCLHGHQFDNFIEQHPWLTWLADEFYRLLQNLDKSHQLARWAKTSSKQFMHNARSVKERAVALMHKRGHDMVCCGHTHHAEAAFPYFNSGCWTEASCCGWVSVDRGTASLNGWSFVK